MTTRLRAADADREAAAQRLADHVGSGRLTTTEYDDRVRQAYAATYLDELDTLFTDLPGGSGNASPFAAAWMPGGGSWGGAPFAGATGAGRIGSAQAWRMARAGARRSPLGAVLAGAVAVVLGLAVLTLVLGAVAFLLHLLFPVLLVLLVVGIVRGRRAARRGWGGGRRGPWGGPWQNGSWHGSAGGHDRWSGGSGRAA